MKYFTTGQVAKLLKVAPRTVSKWFDSGRLKGFRIPGSQDRRIPQPHLVAFCREYDIPLEGAIAEILIVSQDAMLLEAVQERVGDKCRIVSAGSAFEAGMRAASASLVMVDLALGDDVGYSIIKSVGGPSVVGVIVPEGRAAPTQFPWIVARSPDGVVAGISMYLGDD